eukprot:jgi/Galph1/3863/GphlegSOOS_G2533.1
MKENKDLCIVGKKTLLVPYEKEFVPLYYRWMQDKELLHQTATEPLSLEEEYENQQSWKEDEAKCSFIVLHIYDEQPKRIVGDVNLFIHGNDEEMLAEVEVMIAERMHRRQGLATEAVQLLLFFACTELGVRTFVAKILCENVASITLFEKIGFKLFQQVPVFEEVHLSRVYTEEEVVKWQQTSQSYIKYSSWCKEFKKECLELIDKQLTSQSPYE